MTISIVIVPNIINIDLINKFNSYIIEKVIATLNNSMTNNNLEDNFYSQYTYNLILNISDRVLIKTLNNNYRDINNN